ncbi:MAG: methyltransferase domain-containing protein [Jaaginema sp. PMC 1079.18]|nr:methyltransferase domain-containing protein [Jaaginema sp. PMC 1080.18]MEC4854166.1 methyltransferase domain-containing protein [Jaaginema sp. PMC 1079.18]MEC4866449.1 methyltransferase domain-containing protein [Jaaginema sp. PMC 1078.18]
MTVRQDTLWKRFLEPIAKVLIDGEALERLSNSIDWEREGDRLRNPDLIYPDYYQSQNFHGVENGYLNSGAAVTYDPITNYVLLPNETWLREDAIKTIKGQPRRILDLGCGTGSTTLLLKQKFPEAEVIGLDLSPYMLVMAEYKAKQANLEIQWLHGLAEATNLPSESFDVVTASLLFHETPIAIAQAIVQEAFRLLQGNGQVMIFDGSQETLRHTDWLTDIFEEPYIKEYARQSVDFWLQEAGFERVYTEQLWWTNQVSHGMKPSPIPTTPSYRTEFRVTDPAGATAPAF